MYATPTKADLDRNLSTISHDARHKARAEKDRLESEYAARGLGQSGPLIRAVIEVCDAIHRGALEEATAVLRDFSERMGAEPAEVAAIARSHLENMGNSVLSELPIAGFPELQQQTLRQYQAVFSQRLDGVLRDFEIGFSRGRNVSLQEPEREKSGVLTVTDARLRRHLLSHLYEMRHRNGGYVPVNDVIFSGFPSIGEDVIAGIGRQLADAGLIDWTAYLSGPVVGSARIKTLGIDAIERGEFTGLDLGFEPRSTGVRDVPKIAMPAEAIEDTRKAVEKLKAGLPALSLPNSVKAEIDSDIAQIEIEMERPAPRGRAIKLFLESAKDRLTELAGEAAANTVAALVLLLGGLLAKHFGVF